MSVRVSRVESIEAGVFDHVDVARLNLDEVDGAYVRLGNPSRAGPMKVLNTSRTLRKELMVSESGVKVTIRIDITQTGSNRNAACLISYWLRGDYGPLSFKITC